MKSEPLHEILEQTARAELAEGRFPGSLSLETKDERPSFEAGIDKDSLSKIRLSYNPQYETDNPGQTGIVIRDVTRHEINHRGYSGFNGCPRTLDDHVERIAEPISEVITAKGFSANDVHYIANALEDTILHADLNGKFALDGISAFFEEVGESTEDKRFTPFYEAHAKLNLMLWGSKAQKREIGRFYSHDKKTSQKVKQVVQNFLEKTGINRLRFNDYRDSTQIRGFLNDKENWPLISKVYAEEFSKLMTPGYAMPILNHSGEGTKGNKTDKKSDSKSPKPSQTEGNEFDREMETPEFKKRRVQKAYSEGESLPIWIDSFEGLDLLYQSLAQRLNMKIESYTQGMRKPIFHYGTRSFDPEKDNLKHTTFGFDENGKVELKKRRFHEDLEIRCKKEPKGFPEARFCLLDTSGSMQEDPNGGDKVGNTNAVPWGDNSKYHFALLGWYGFIEYMRQNHLLSGTNISLANFSNKTYLASGLEDAKRLALKPQFGNTYLDDKVVKNLFEGQGKLVFTISDGGIDNWDELGKDFIKKAKNHQYFHLQIGPKNETTEEMQKAGLKVEYIQNARDLATRVIDLTDTLYRGGVQ